MLSSMRTRIGLLTGWYAFFVFVGKLGKTVLQDPSLLADAAYEGMIGTVLGLFGRGTNTAIDLVENLIHRMCETIKSGQRKMIGNRLPGGSRSLFYMFFFRIPKRRSVLRGMVTAWLPAPYRSRRGSSCGWDPVFRSCRRSRPAQPSFQSARRHSQGCRMHRRRRRDQR